ncbi:MAG: type II toxin-antitoxin system RelE/ParE family toxin [Vicinamibacterales bacterium]
MNERRVRFTATADEHVDRERTWWRDHRDHQELFATELENALQILALLPGAGTPYTQSPTPDLRRIYLRKLGCHLYYTFDDREVIVRAMWGARRERGPVF